MKAIYQRYMGWFDGNPAHLWEHPPVEPARRYVEFMGGAEAVARAAPARAFEAGDYRWVAEVVNHVVFAEPENEAARELQADALEQLGYGAENATWRNFFLMGAQELREGISGTPTATAPPTSSPGSRSSQLLDAMAIRLDGPRAWDARLRIDWVVTDPDEQHLITVRERRPQPPPRHATADGRRGPDRRARGARTSCCSKPPTWPSWPRAAACGSRATARSWASCSACSTSPTRASRSSPRT